MWWKSKGILYYKVLNDGETVTAEGYINQLQNLNSAVQLLRPETYQKDVLLQHDSASPHTRQLKGWVGK